jgi:uncharacterized protein (DUF885 family)
MRPCITLSLLCLVLVAAAPVRAATGDTAVEKLGREYLDQWMRRHPPLATRLGVHTWDDVLIPITQATVDDDATWLRAFRERLRAVPARDLGFDARLDRALLAGRVERELLELETVQSWRTNPNTYVDLISGPVQSLLQRNFASLSTRMRSAARRLRMVPEVLRAARINLSHPSRLATEVAIAQTAGVLQFYRGTVPALTAASRDPDAQADLAEADTAAVRAVQSFQAFLREDLLPHADGSFALGRDVYQRKLLADEMESAPVESLLARGERSLAETRSRMEVLAEKITPGAGVRAALDQIGTDRPDAEHLVPFVAGRLDSIRAFVRTHDLLTVPAREHLIVRETPLFRRSLSFASMDSPGVWEHKAAEAYYNVTPPDPNGSERDIADHLAFFNRAATDIVSIHEALPGHYYQFLALRGVHSPLRQALSCGSNVEGWAHYCEQMAIEQGYGGGDPRYELSQLHLAAQRLGRLIVGISLHTRGMTIEQAQQVFEERCYMSPVNAAREARRGALDPTYLVYTLGKWRILELRDEVRQRLGARFRLREFDDAFLRAGAVPLPIARAIVLNQLTGSTEVPAEP